MVTFFGMLFWRLRLRHLAKIDQILQNQKEMSSKGMEWSDCHSIPKKDISMPQNCNNVRISMMREQIKGTVTVSILHTQWDSLLSFHTP